VCALYAAILVVCFACGQVFLNTGGPAFHVAAGQIRAEVLWQWGQIHVNLTVISHVAVDLLSNDKV